MMTTDARPRPQGVAIHHADGTITACELAYQGVNDDGMTVWEIATQVRFTKGDQLHVDVFPAQTTIAMPCDLEAPQ